MSLMLQYPALIGLLALAGLPALVHLLSRARPPVYRFPDIHFLRRVLRNTSRVRKPTDRLLLVLRTLALLSLAGVFISPFLISKSAALPGEARTVVLLIDRSASMAAREGAGSRFEAACAQAAGFLDASKPDRANLVWIDAEPDAVFPEPGPNLVYLTDLLKRAEPLPEAGALEAAFALVLRQLSAGSGHRELVVISDFQQSAWKDFSPRLPENLVVRAVRIGQSAPANLAVTHLVAQPAEPVVGQELTLLAKLRSYSPEPVRAEVTLDADGARQSQAVDLPAWGESECAFTVRPQAPGQLPVTASISGDAFPADDARHLVVSVRDALRLSISAPEASPEAVLLTRFAEALPWLDSGIGNSQVGTADFRFLASWAGGNPEDLREAAKSGTTVIVRPAAGCPLAAIRSLGNFPPDATDGPLAMENRPAAWSVVPDENHPANRLFRSGDFGNPFAGVFGERLKIPAAQASAPGVRSIATYTDGTPAVLEIPTERASILLWNLSLDAAKTDWPTQGNFLPALAEMLLRTRPRSTGESAVALPGSRLSWTSADPAHANAVELAGPSKQAVEVRSLATPAGTTWQAVAPAVPGIYQWRISGQAVAGAAVNFPETESDLRPLDRAPAFVPAGSSDGPLVRQAAMARGLPLWQWLAVAALFFVSLESLVQLRSAVRN